MANTTRRIGLSLGADLCWPLCFEHILNRLELEIEDDGDSVQFEVERIWIEPYDLKKDCRWELVIDRLTHWYHTSREWIKKAIIMNDLYVFNNPWSLQSMEKHTTYCAMMRLGMPIPETWMVPPKSYEPSADLAPTLERYAKLFDLGQLGDKLGYPLIIKPYDGGGWRAVSKVADEAALKKAYDDSGKLVMHLQQAVEPRKDFVRCIGFGPQTRLVRYDDKAPLHDRYMLDQDFLSAEDAQIIKDTTLTINTFFGWEFNSCEMIQSEGIWHPIDFANACPDSQVTSLHFHFPWLVKAYLKWAIYCVATRRSMRKTLDWGPYYAIADRDMNYEEKLKLYAQIANERLESDRFHAFCDEHLGHLDEVAHEYFGSEDARQAIHAKVASLYPEHEIESFTELFWGRIQQWRQLEGEQA